MRRTATLIGLTVLVGLGGCERGEPADPGARAVTPAAAPAERIVLVVVDTLRADHLSPYGADVETPRIAALAERGQVFTRFRASYHQTSMSMASLFTGRVPSLETGSRERALEWTGENWCGLRRLATGAGARCVPASARTLAESIRAAGYWTAGVVTNALLFRPAGFDRGFDRWEEIGGDTRDPELRNASRANAAVRRVLAERPGDRLFLYVHYVDVHDYGRRRIPYARSVEWMDRDLGALLGILEEEGLLEGARVVLTSDHGERLGERHLVEGHPKHFGNPSFEEVLWVPLVIAPPVDRDPGQPLRSDDLTRLIVELAGGAPDEAELLAPDEQFLSERDWQTYRRGRWKSFRDRASGRLRLVDLGRDPAERQDVAAEHPERVAAHARRMDELAAELAAEETPPSTLTPEDAERLRALGYLE